MPGDAKFTNLKETIFQDDFIIRREVKKPPLDKAIIRDRLREWPQRAKEIKYVSKAGKSFRTLYKSATPDEKIHLLAKPRRTFMTNTGGAMSYTLPNGKEIISEVLLKLKEEELPRLPMACKVCPAAMWQLTGAVNTPKIRCFCRVMHIFTWDSQNQEEVLDCDIIYQPEKE